MRGMAIHEGSCHCGRIEFTLDGDIDGVVDCNCSMCRRRGSLLAFFPRGAMVLKTTTPTSPNKPSQHAIRHRFARTAGALHRRGIHPKNGEATIAVNVRCLTGVDLDGMASSRRRRQPVTTPPQRPRVAVNRADALAVEAPSMMRPMDPRQP